MKFASIYKEVDGANHPKQKVLHIFVDFRRFNPNNRWKADDGDNKLDRTQSKKNVN